MRDPRETATAQLHSFCAPQPGHLSLHNNKRTTTIRRTRSAAQCALCVPRSACNWNVHHSVDELNHIRVHEQRLLELMLHVHRDSTRNPWKSSRILCVNPNFFIFSFCFSFFPFFHFFIFFIFPFFHFFNFSLFSFFHFFIFSCFFSIFHFSSCSFIFDHFLSFSIIFVHFLLIFLSFSFICLSFSFICLSFVFHFLSFSFIFLHFPSFSFIFFHFLSFSFIFFHFLSFSFIFFHFFSLLGAQNLIFSGLNFVTISHSSNVKNQFVGPSRVVGGTPLGTLFLFSYFFLSRFFFFCLFSCFLYFHFKHFLFISSFFDF